MERPRRAKGSRGSRWPAARPRSHGSQARLSRTETRGAGERVLGDPTGKCLTPWTRAPHGPAASELRSPCRSRCTSAWSSQVADPAEAQSRGYILDPLSGRTGPLAPNLALSPARACAGRNAGPSTFSRAGINPGRGLLQLRAAAVPRGVRLLWDPGNPVASPACVPAAPPSVLPCPPLCGRPRFGKGNSHRGSIWDLERDCDAAALSEGINLRSFFRTSPTCLLLNVRVMGSASDKTAYYS